MAGNKADPVSGVRPLAGEAGFIGLTDSRILKMSTGARA